MPKPVSSSALGQKASSDRLFYLDCIRAFACLSVVMLHVSSNYVIQTVGSTGFWVGNIFDSLSRAAVPLFVMLSGALMLDEDYTFTKEKWIRHIVSLLLFFVFWSAFYCVIYQMILPIFRHEKISLFSIVFAFFKGNSHLWFIPMTIGLYLLVPLLRLWVTKANRRYVAYYLILSLLFAFVIPQALQWMIYFKPSFISFEKLLDRLQIHYPLGYTSYFILGWYLRSFEWTKKQWIYALGLLGACVTMIGTYVELSFTQSEQFLFYSEFSVNVFVYSAAIFVLFKSLFGNPERGSQKLHQAVHIIEKNSLGIYSIHMVLVFVLTRLMASFPALFAIPATFILAITLSLLCTRIIRKLPLLRKMV